VIIYFVWSDQVLFLTFVVQPHWRPYARSSQIWLCENKLFLYSYYCLVTHKNKCSKYGKATPKTFLFGDFFQNFTIKIIFKNYFKFKNKKIKKKPSYGSWPQIFFCILTNFAQNKRMVPTSWHTDSIIILFSHLPI
jgi:hypothetical protein